MHMMKKWKLILGVGISFTIILAGCSSSKSEPTSHEKESDSWTKTKVDIDPPMHMEHKSAIELLETIDKVSVITPEGKEIELDQTLIVDELISKLSRLQPSDYPISSNIYTLVLRQQNNTPLVIQIADDGVKISGISYTGEEIPNIIDDVGDAIAKQILSGMVIDQLSLISIDSPNRPVDFNEAEREELSAILEKAVFLPKAPDIIYPLFPHYVVQIMGEDKSVINVDIIAKNIIAIPYGKELALYYKVEENLYDRFYSLLPPFDFSEDNPKSLFLSNGMEISQGNGIPIQFGGIGMESPQIDSITDSFVRILSEGKRSEREHAGEIKMTFLFYQKDKEKKVEIYENGYRYGNDFYELPNLVEKIEKQLNEVLH